MMHSNDCIYRVARWHVLDFIQIVIRQMRPDYGLVPAPL